MGGPARQMLPVTVVVPAFNRQDMVARAIRSVGAQRRFRPAEIICVDDASDDGTSAAAQAAGARVVRHDANRGAAAARNTALAAASQPWIALLDSDDEWLPGHLETLWPARRGKVLVAGSALAVQSDGTARVHGRVVPWAARLPSPRRLLWLNLIPASGNLVRADVVRASGGFDTGLRFAEDLDLWLRVLDAGPGIVLDTPVCVWHQHGGQKSGTAVPSFAVHREIATRHEQRAWFRRRWYERRVGLQEWDVFRARAAAGEGPAALRELAGVLASPNRSYGIAGGVLHRALARRRGRRIAPALLRELAQATASA